MYARIFLRTAALVMIGTCLAPACGLSQVMGLDPSRPRLLQAAPEYPTAGVGAITSADFDGDGDVDLALGGKELGLGALGDTLSVLLNAGDGTFNSRADYATTVTSLASLDIDGDGDTDLAVATGNQAVQLLKNRGDGTFDPDAALPLEGRAWQVVADDLDADGDADLLVATSLPGQMVVFLNREGILSPVGAVTGPMGLIATGKLDGDPLPDVVMTHTSNRLSVLRNRGAGAFESLGEYDAGGFIGSVLVTDLDRDGADELIVSHQTGHTVAVLHNRGDATFDDAVPFVVPGPPRGLVAADFDGDGIVDVATAAGVRSAVAILRGDGAGRLAETGIFGVNAQPWALATADFDRDGRPDIACPNPRANTVSVLLNRGGGRFPARIDLEHFPGAPYSVTVADFDGDGRDDLASGRLMSSPYSPDLSVISVQGGLGDLGFGTPVDYVVDLQRHYPDALVAGDLDGDGAPDLVLTRTGEDLMILWNQGNGTFGLPASFRTGPGSAGLALEDYDADGRLDVAVVRSDEPVISVLWNEGHRVFSDPLELDLGGGTGASIASGDLDQDGRPDIVVGNGGARHISVLRNLGHRLFEGPAHFPTGGVVTAVAVGDVDGDGDADVAVDEQTSWTDAVSILLNPGDGTLGTSEPQSAVEIRARTLSMSDLDRDGDLDLVALGQGGGIAALRNQGGGTFRLRTFCATSGVGLAMATGDLDGDGDDDLAIADRPAMTVSLFRSHEVAEIRAVAIDVKPGDPNNLVPLHSRGELRAAVLGSAEFDAGTVNPKTLVLAGALVHQRGNRPEATLEDINRDGFPDLVGSFGLEDLDLDAAATPAILRGHTWDGEPLRGADRIKVVAPQRAATESGPWRLALQAVGPNPSRGAVQVDFDLPVGAPAMLELMDIAGRVVSRRDLSGLGPGTHALQIAGSPGMAAGVYFVRLGTKGERVTRKVVFAP